MQSFKFRLFVLALMASSMHAETCRRIHGRAIWYRGDGFFEIWHIGTHHIFFPADGSSSDLICKYFDCESGNRQPVLFADFTVCPTLPYKLGAAQPAIVKEVNQAHVISDWPSPRSARKFIEQFYSWYVPQAQLDDASWKPSKALRLSQWDLSPSLAKPFLGSYGSSGVPCRRSVGNGVRPILQLPLAL